MRFLLFFSPLQKIYIGFVESGTVEFPDLKRSYDYTYNKLEENINLRTLLTLSLQAQNFVENDTFSKYREYFVSPLYSDEITTAAFNNRTTGTKRGEMDFSLFNGKGNAGTWFDVSPPCESTLFFVFGAHRISFVVFTKMI